LWFFGWRLLSTQYIQHPYNPFALARTTPCPLHAGSIMDTAARRRAPAAVVAVVCGWALELAALSYATAVWAVHVSD
jgi:hypothetical protein